MIAYNSIDPFVEFIDWRTVEIVEIVEIVCVEGSGELQRRNILWNMKIIHIT